jgi:hypothetical protein
MAERLTLLDRWKLLESVMRDLALARNDLIVARDLLDRWHVAIGGSRTSTRTIAARTGLSRSRVQACLRRLVAAGHFVMVEEPGGSKAPVYAPRGPIDGASPGPTDGATTSHGGPADGAAIGPVDGASNAVSGPTDGAPNPLRVSPVALRRGETRLAGC